MAPLHVALDAKLGAQECLDSPGHRVLLSSEGPKVERERGYRHEPLVTLRRRGGSERRNLSESGPESGAETADSCHCDAGNRFMKRRLGVGNS